MKRTIQIQKTPTNELKKGDLFLLWADEDLSELRKIVDFPTNGIFSYKSMKHAKKWEMERGPNYYVFKIIK